MINKTEPLEISKIFPVNSSIIYKIPKYQRKYTWGQSEWNLLFNDIIENNDGYFLGSSICVNANDKEDLYSNIKMAEVIDGQQRITTLSILLAVLYTKILKYKTENDSGYILDEDEITDEIIEKNDIPEEAPKPLRTPEEEREIRNKKSILVMTVVKPSAHKTFISNPRVDPINAMPSQTEHTQSVSRQPEQKSDVSSDTPLSVFSKQEIKSANIISQKKRD